MFNWCRVDTLMYFNEIYDKMYPVICLKLVWKHCDTKAENRMANHKTHWYSEQAENKWSGSYLNIIDCHKVETPWNFHDILLFQWQYEPLKWLNIIVF